MVSTWILRPRQTINQVYGQNKAFSTFKKSKKENYLPCPLFSCRKLLENTHLQNEEKYKKRKIRIQEAGHPTIITKEAG